MNSSYDEYDCANNSRESIRYTVSIEANTFSTSTSPVPTARWPVHVPLLHSEIFTCCEDNLPPLGYLDCQSDEKRISLRDRARLRNDPQWVPSFLSSCCLMFPERLRNKSEVVGSEETRQVLTVHPRYETLSY